MNHNICVLTDVCKGNISQLKVLKQQDPNFHWSTLFYPKTKETCLHLAAQFGHVKIIEYLLSEFRPKHIEIRNIDNKTPLHAAAQFGKFDCVELLLQNGADINAIKRSDWTPLMLACTKNDDCFVHIVQYLLDRGALSNFQNKDGWTSLHIAARNTNSNILKLLLSNEVDVTVNARNGRNALHIAALHGNLNNVELLISLLDPNAVDSSGNTSLHEAVASGNLAVVDYLIDKGADISMSNKTGANALHLAAGLNLNSVIHHLVTKYGFDVNAVDNNGYTALHYAIRKCNDSAVKILTKLGSDIHILDKSGRMASDYMSTLHRKV